MPRAAVPPEAPREPLSRERVLQAAVALADREGISALTMRRLARDLAVEAMTLYYYLANKEEILDGIIDVVYGEMEVPSIAAGWKPSMRQRALSARAALTHHPWAIGLMESRRRPGPANLRHHDSVLAVLLSAGFTSATATRAYNTLDSYIYGFALQEATLPLDPTEEVGAAGEELLGQVMADEYPNLARVGGELIEAGFIYADEFEHGLDLILDGIERMHAGA